MWSLRRYELTAQKNKTETKAFQPLQAFHQAAPRVPFNLALLCLAHRLDEARITELIPIHRLLLLLYIFHDVCVGTSLYSEGRFALRRIQGKVSTVRSRGANGKISFNMPGKIISSAICEALPVFTRLWETL